MVSDSSGFFNFPTVFPFPLGLVFRAFESRSAFSHKSMWQVVELIPQMGKTAYILWELKP